MADEENFPRGGTVSRKRPRQEIDNLFNLSKPSKVKKQKKSKKQVSTEPGDDVLQTILNIRGTLSYNKLQTGMVILGCVRNIGNFALSIELPGLCFATVGVTEISDPFTKYLNQQLESNDPDTNSILSKMFSVGEYLPVKIINIETKDKGTNVEGSINPREIYAEQNADCFKKEMLVWSCVSSKTDHGFEMNMGVKHCRAFLPDKNNDEGVEHVIGRPMWCVVHKSDSSASILRLSAKTEHLNKAKFEVDNLHTVLPGMKVDFVSDRITSHGIQGKFSDFIGYVDENFLSKPLKKVTDYQEGKILSAYILYVEPTTRITHLTLRRPEKEEQPEITVGEVVVAEVFNKTHNGLLLALPNKLKGFTTNKRLINTLPKKDQNITDAINHKYPIGSRHQCRVMDYNHIAKMYICTPESSLVKESVFANSDLIPGQLVDVKIVNVKDEGIVVTTGHVQGFVPNLHISNVEYSANVKRKFKTGQKVTARVLTVENDKVLFTLKPSMVESEECLTKLEEAQVGKQYTGVVCRTSDKGALIVFYANILGKIGKKGLGNDVADVSKYFFTGQVVKTYVAKVKSGRIYLSLYKPQPKIEKVNLGRRFAAIVNSINQKGVNISIENSKRKGIIPNIHLSSSVSLCGAVKNTLSPGDRLTDVIYVGGTKPQIFSRREGMAMKGKKLPTLDELKIGDVIRCFFQKNDDNGVYVVPFLKDFASAVFISKKYIGDKIPDVVEHQLLLAKVNNINSKKQILELSIKLSDVYDNKIENTVNNFIQHLNELQHLYHTGKKLKWDICQYHPGNQVECNVEIVEKDGAVVVLPNGAKGIAVPYLCPKSLKPGTAVKGTVISHDFSQKFVNVCLSPNMFGRINPRQDGTLSDTIVMSFVEKLIVNADCIVGVLRHSKGNKQLVYLPTKVHANDFEGTIDYYTKKRTKICLCGKMKRFLIGISKKLFLHLDKSTTKKSANETIVESSDSGIEEQPSDVVIESDFEEETQEPTTIALPGISSFFTPSKSANVDESSSEDEDGPKAKKTKLESKQLEPKIEEDSNKAPESPEQFEKAVSGKPNSAELWTQYVSFYLAGSEIEKARAIAHRALTKVDMTLINEKFKLWMVLLNLENQFGTKESFDKVFEEALRCNDALQVNLKAIGMLAESGKYGEMEVIIDKVRMKYKQEPSMWMEVAKTYYQLGKFNEARSCKERSLKSILDKKTQMTLIVRFAIMEFKYGDEDQGCAIFEAILTTDPKKTNIWITYVDQLVKKQKYDDARQVLERAVSQRLPLKNMKSLFMKFRKFEEDHGTKETLEGVKQRAQEYISRFEK